MSNASCENRSCEFATVKLSEKSNCRNGGVRATLTGVGDSECERSSKKQRGEGSNMRLAWTGWSLAAPPLHDCTAPSVHTSPLKPRFQTWVGEREERQGDGEWNGYWEKYFISLLFLTSSVFLDVTLSILGSFTLDVALLFWVITSLYLYPITCSHGTLLFFILSISLLFKNYLGVRDLKSVTSNKKRRKYFFCQNMFIV